MKTQYPAKGYIDIPVGHGSDMIAIMDGPSRKAKFITTIHDMEEVIVTRRPFFWERWVKIRYMNVEGYVQRKFVFVNVTDE